MRLRILLSACFAIICLSISAQNTNFSNITGTPLLAATQTPLADVAAIHLPSLDNDALMEAELLRRAPGVAPRFAETIIVDASPVTHGTWEEIGFGELVWRLRIPSSTAKSINLGFDEFYMPPGASLFLHNSDYSTVQGPFTPADNEKHGEFWTPIIPGDELIIEVQIPRSQVSDLRLHLKSVNHDFVGFLQISESLSGSCNLDVICGEEDGFGIVDNYRDIIRSVGVISTGGSTLCTGYLINNARQDCTPYFMTAAHCGVNNNNAASLVVYWNFENSTCREPGSGASGGNGDGSQADFNTGSFWRATYGGGGSQVALGDATIVELDDPVSETANAFFAGWDVTGILAYDTVIGIHHPNTDEKRISFEFEPTSVTDYLSNTADPNTNWIRIADWNIGTTEGGSSGSPLFNTDKQVIGLLSGGFAACGNDDEDWYGWLTVSWEGGGTPQSRLKDWLDPDNTGQLTLGGREQMLCSFFVATDTPNQSLCAPETATYVFSVSENFTSDVALQVTGLPAGLIANFDNATIPSGGNATLTVSGTGAVADGTYSFTVEASDGTNSSSQVIFLSITAAVPATTNLLAPVDLAMEQSTILTLSWDAIPNVTSYDLQIATDVGFGDIISEVTGISGTSQITDILDITSTYFWRVRANNLCGTGAWSETYSFSTADLFCGITPAQNLPVTISGGSGGTYTSTLDLNIPGEIVAITLTDLDITHSYVGDINATLTSPAGLGITIDLFGQPGNGSCNQENLLVSFDDLAGNTYADFQASCNGGGLAIEGNYQSQDPLSIFIGEEAAGTWTLTVVDNFFNDGGSINGWNLEICAAIPNIVSIDASFEEEQTCLGQQLDFTVELGTGFLNNDITLSAADLPTGSNITFGQNPATPGSMVDVSLDGLPVGSHTISLIANDGATEVNTEIIVNVNTILAAPAPNTPLNNSIDASLSVLLDWSAVAGANSYDLIVSTAPDFTTIFSSETVSINSSQLTGLDHGTTYYWMVLSNNECGSSGASPTFNFTTIPNLSLASNNTSMAVCLTGMPTYILDIGEGFGDDFTVDFMTTPLGAFQLNNTFDTDLRELTVTASDLGVATDYSYTITVILTNGDYTNEIDLSLIINQAPDLSTLVTPINTSIVQAETPIIFTWTATDNTDSYLIEVATDTPFSNIVQSEEVSGTSVTFEFMEEGSYFWRVKGSNECGDATTAPWVFETMAVGTQEINGAELTISPNPTTGLLQIHLSDNLTGDLDIEAYSVNGQRIQTWRLPAIGGSQNINMGHWPGGVYTFKVSNGQSQLIERIVLIR